MTRLHEFTGQVSAHGWMVRSLGWTLLHFCWQGALVAIILWCVLRLLSGASAQARYVAACFALGLMAMLPLATLEHVGLAEYRLEMALRGSIAGGPGLIVQAGVEDAGMPWLAGFAAALDGWMPWVLMAWLAGAALFLVRLSVGFEVTRRMRTVAVHPVSAELQAAFEGLRRRLRVQRPVMLIHSGLVQVPTVIGWLRPVVLLPVSCFTGLSEMQMEAVLCHELAHVLRHDYLVSVLQSVTEALLFYHPGVWWVSKQVRRERECCCDDVAVSVGGNALAYARALSTLEVRRGAYPQAMLGADGGVLTMRIKRLLQGRESAAASPVAAVVVLTLLVASAVSVGGSVRAQARTVTVMAPAAAAKVTQTEAALAQVSPVVDSSSAAERTAPPVANTRARRTTAKADEDASAGAPQVQAAGLGRGQAAGQSAGHGEGVGTGQGVAAPARVAGGVMAGQIVTKAQPSYPAEAKAARVQGAVVLRAVISKTGEIENLQVVSGPKELVDSAMTAVRQWTYKPYLLNGNPTEVETTITVNYHMSDMPDLPGPAAQNEGPDAAGQLARPIGNGIGAPVVIYTAQPDYSEQARAKKISGNVLVHLWVDEEGNPIHVRVVRGIGYGLDEKAVEAVRQYRFKAAMEDGRPVTVALNVEVNFRIF